MNDGRNFYSEKNNKDYMKSDNKELSDNRLLNKHYENLMNEQRNKIHHIIIDDNTARIRNESPTMTKNLRIISNSPNRLDKPNFFGINPNNNNINIITGKSNINNDQSPKRNVTNNFDTQNNKLVNNSPKLNNGTKNIKSVDTNLTNSLNSIFNSFSNSSVMKPMNKANKADNLVTKDVSYTSAGINSNNNNIISSPQYFSTKKKDLITAVSTYMSNKEKTMNQQFNGNSIAGNITNLTRITNDNAPKSTAIIPITSPKSNLSNLKPKSNYSNTMDHD